MIITYCRVSTTKQDVGLDAQQATIGEYLKHHSDIADIALRKGLVEFEEKQSAKDMRRPELSKAVALAEKHKGVLIVAKLDRLSRSVADFATLVDRANKHGWKIVVCDLNIDMTTPSGLLIANIMAALAQWERGMIGQRTKEALAEKRKQGIHPGRPYAKGYVKLVREWRARGMTLQQIADKMNSAGIERAAKGKRWYRSTVQSVLRRAS